MHSENQTPRINAAKEFGALVAACDGITSEELRLKAVSNQIEKAINEICEQYRDANGKVSLSKEQIECISHICLQMYCILDPSTKPPSNSIDSFRRDFNQQRPLAKWKTVGGFLAGMVAITALYDFAKNKFFPPAPQQATQSSQPAQPQGGQPKKGGGAQ